jgi:putative oxidoreductase
MDRAQAQQVTLLLLRVVAGAMFMQHGGMKLFGWFGGVGHGPLPPMLAAAGIIEFFGGMAIVLGLLTRPIAFVLSGEMAVAYFMAHQPHGLSPLVNKGELAVLYCFIYLLLSAYGAGAFSVDALLWRPRQKVSAS